MKERVVLEVFVEDGDPELIRWGDWGWAVRVRLTYTHPRNGIRGTIEELVRVPDPDGFELRRGSRAHVLWGACGTPYSSAGWTPLHLAATAPGVESRLARRSHLAPKSSAGVLLHRRGMTAGKFSSFLQVDPTGRAKTPGRGKGEFNPGEDPLESARREFTEETGLVIAGRFVPLLPVKQPGGKVVHAFAVEGDCDPASIKSNTFSLEWPPRSGRRQEFPEIDRGGWFGLEEASVKIGKGQTTPIDQLRVLVGEIPGARRAKNPLATALLRRIPCPPSAALGGRRAR